MDQEKFLQLQMQMRHNNDDYKNFLDDIESWSSEMKCKEEKIIRSSNTKNNLPQIRNTKKCEKPKAKQPKIKAYDYKSWDKFDVDKALEECDKEDKAEIDQNKNLDYAIELKDAGNTSFKRGDYFSAIEQYTQALSYDPNNDLLFTNRAMSYIKLGNYEAGEIDCSQAIAINNKAVKAFYRRAKCRIFLKKREEAIGDYKAVLNIEPDNKLAFKEMKELEMELNTRGVVEPLYQPLKNRTSTKPLMRIDIIDVNPNKAFDHSSVKAEFIPSVGEVEIGEKSMELNKGNCPGINGNKLSISSKLISDENADKTFETKIQFRVPKTSVQLTKDLSNYRSNANHLATYVTSLNCVNYSKLIGHALDSELLLDLVNGLSLAVKLNLLTHDKFIECFNYLYKVSRFSSSWFMISNEEKVHFNEAVALFDKDLLNKLPLTI